MIVTPFKCVDLKPAAKVQVATDVLWASWIGRLNVEYFGFMWLELFDEGTVINKRLRSMGYSCNKMRKICASNICRGVDKQSHLMWYPHILG